MTEFRGTLFQFLFEKIRIQYFFKTGHDARFEQPVGKIFFPEMDFYAVLMLIKRFKPLIVNEGKVFGKLRPQQFFYLLRIIVHGTPESIKDSRQRICRVDNEGENASRFQNAAGFFGNPFRIGIADCPCRADHRPAFCRKFPQIIQHVGMNKLCLRHFFSGLFQHAGRDVNPRDRVVIAFCQPFG